MNASYNNPLVYQRADPYLYLHTDGYYYFTGSVPGYNYIAIRRAKKLNDLLTADERIVWHKHDEGKMGAHIWAPELHRINNEWYIYFAAGESSDIWNIRPYALKCSDDDPMNGTWTEMGEVDIGAGGGHCFALDMTTFEYLGSRYNIWAQKKESDSGSCLYIAKMSDPLHAEGTPVRISVPQFDWEKQGHSVNEGPAVLKHGDKIFVFFSASDTGWRYCMGMLWMNLGDNPLNTNSWTKLPVPIFKTNERKSIFGPGHNCFSKDGDTDIIVYHCRRYKETEGDPLYDCNRHARAGIVRFDSDGFPLLKC